MTHRPWFAWFTCPFALLVAALAAQEPATSPVPTAVAPADGAAIRKELAAIASELKVPALGGAIFTTRGLDGAWVAGVRAAGDDASVTEQDLWHLGSCTKAMTATLLALLVERGDLAWDRKLPELLPELAPSIDQGYADVTLVELLAHRAGVPAMTGPDAILEHCSTMAGTTTEQRHELSKRVLSAPPASKPRGKCTYSNAGFVIAGHIAEQATGKTWEELMRELLFVPLGMTSAGFGPPGTAQHVDQPRGHDNDGKAIAPGADADNPPVIGPAGTVHASLADWARFLQLHLRGAQGDVEVGAITLHRDTVARLHTAWPADDAAYGYGWLMPKRDWAGGDHTVLTHSGSNTMWFCVCWLDPATGFGVLATTNIANRDASKATDRVSALLLQNWLTRRKAASMTDAAGKK